MITYIIIELATFVLLLAGLEIVRRVKGLSDLTVLAGALRAVFVAWWRGSEADYDMDRDCDYFDEEDPA